jgi:spore germination protein KA
MKTDFEELLKQSIGPDLSQSRRILEPWLKVNVDIVSRSFYLRHPSLRREAVFLFVDGLIKTDIIDSGILRPMTRFGEHVNTQEDQLEEVADEQMLLEVIIKEVLLDHGITVAREWEKAILALLSGDTLLLVDGVSAALIVSSRGGQARSIDEPMTEPVLKGPRDGFTEQIRTNTAMVRRRIRDPLFRIEALQLGTKTKTDIHLAYIEGTVKEGLVEEVKQRLGRIQIDGVIDSGYVEELIEDAPLSPFSTLQSTERPDKVAASLLEGRIAIFVDNSPFVLIAPTYFWQFFQASDDYYSRYWVGSFFRMVRLLALVISLTLPSIYVLFATFHQEMLPTELAITIASAREGVPFPALFEGLLMEIVFELMREAGLRMPRPIGSAVSIVGSLVIGQAAVQAGVVGTFLVIVVAVTGIASFALPNFAGTFSLRVLRFPLLIASGTTGLLGFATVFTLILIHAVSLRSFGESYFAPATPFVPSDQKDVVMRAPWWLMRRRPAMADGDPYRLDPDSFPHPPVEEGTGLRPRKPAKERMEEPMEEPDSITSSAPTINDFPSERSQQGHRPRRGEPDEP